jgi:transketolase
MSTPCLTFADRLRRLILEQAKRAHKGHIGSALSIADIVAALYDGLLRPAAPDDPERDRLILAKGHAVLALYAALHLREVLSAEELDRYCAEGTCLGVHPEHVVPGIDFSTGSLGQGLSVAAGCALAARLQHSSRRVFVLMSDAECNEGAVWEAVMFAAHHRLANLIAIVDMNGQQALGTTAEVLNMEPMAARWRAFDWEVQEVDGHDVAAITAAVNAACEMSAGPPHVILAKTIAGYGVSFMERQVKWHYWPMSDEEYEQALAEIENRP